MLGTPKVRTALTRIRRAIPLPLQILGVTLLVIVVLFSLKPAPPLKPSHDLLPLVQAIPAAPAEHRPMVTLYGRLESPRESSLASTINAYVASVPAEEGQWVQAGDLLVELEDSDVQLAYQQRLAEVENLQAQIASEQIRFQNDQKSLQVEKELVQLSQKSADRYEQLVERKVGSDLNRDEALQQARAQVLNLYNREYAIADHPHRLQRLQAQLQQAEALRDQAALDLARCRITAPFAGRVTALNASPGNRVRPGDVLVSLFDASYIQVRAQIPSRYLNPVETALAAGMQLDASFDLGQRQIPLILQQLAGSIGLGQGGVDALFKLQQDDHQLTLGRAGEVYLHMPPVANSLALPPTAIYGQQRIYSIVDGVLHTVMIQRLGEVLTAAGERWQLVAADIAPGTPILSTQLANAVGGLKVKVAAAEPAEPAEPSAP